MTNYELLFIVPSTVSDKEIPQIAEKVAQLIQKEGAKITEEDNLGRKKLTFPIKKSEVGTYLIFQFSGDSQIVNKLDKVFKLTPQILRYLIVINPPKPPLVQKKRPAGQVVPHQAAPTRTSHSADDKKKINLEDLEEKLDNILEDDILT